MVRLDEEDVPGNPSAPLDAEAEARALALDGLLSPLSAPPDLGPMASQGQAAQSLGDAARSQGMPETWAGRDATAGLGDRDIIAPRAGGSATMPDVPAYDPRRDHASASVVRPTPAAAPATPTSAAMPTPGPAAPPLAPTSSETGQPVTQPKTATQRGESALDREMRAAQEARARRMIGNAFGTVVEMAGALSTGVPIQPGQATPAGPAEDEVRIAREHRLAAAQKDREGREAALEAARAEREATLEDREFDLRSRALDIQAARAGQPQTPRDLDVARAEQIRNAIADREARRDASSEQSRAAQAAFRGLINTLPPRMRQGLGASFDDATLATMSADALAPSIARLSRVTERIGASGGNSAAMAQRRERASSVVDLAVNELGMDRAVAETMPPAQLARMIADAQIGSSQERQQRARQEILPGVSTSLAISAGEAAEQRDAMAQARASYANLSSLNDIASEGGTLGALSPRQRGLVAPRLAIGRGMVANLARLGIIQPSEVDNINGTLPNPNELEQMSLGTLQSRLTAWRGLLEENIRAGLSSHGVDDEGVERAIQFLRSGRGMRRPSESSQPSRTTPGTATAPAADMVRVRRVSDGRTGTIPRASLSDAYEVIQ